MIKILLFVNSTNGTELMNFRSILLSSKSASEEGMLLKNVLGSCLPKSFLLHALFMIIKSQELIFQFSYVSFLFTFLLITFGVSP